jgi:predicted metalloprotease
VPIEDQEKAMNTNTSTSSRSSASYITLAFTGVAVLATAALGGAGIAAQGAGPRATDFAGVRTQSLGYSQDTSELVTTAAAPDFDAFLATMVEDSANYWSGQLAAWEPVYGTAPWQPLYYSILDSGESATSQCNDGNGQLAVAGDPDELPGTNPAFFCSEDMTVYLSSPWLYDHIWNAPTADSTEASDFGVAYAIAHEVGHAVQFDLGITDPTDATTVAPTELQADCLAGVWSNAKYYENVLEGNDISEAVTTAAAVGDYELTDPGHHGMPEQRAAAFMVGYNSGDAGTCTLDLDSTV